MKRQAKMGLGLPEAELLRLAKQGAALDYAGTIERQRAMRKRFPGVDVLAKQILTGRQMAKARAARKRESA